MSSSPVVPGREEAEETVNREAPRPPETGAGGDDGSGTEATHVVPAGSDEEVADGSDEEVADGSEDEEDVEDMDADDDDGSSEDDEDVDDMDDDDDSGSEEEGELSQSQDAKIVKATIESSCGKAGDVEDMPSAGHAICSICMDPWTCNGAHRICCIPCGHVYGRSCLEKWLRRAINPSAKCPQCGQGFEKKLITNLYAPENLLGVCGHIQEVKKLNKALVHLLEILRSLPTNKATIDAGADKMRTQTEAQSRELRAQVENLEGQFAIFNAQLASMKEQMRKMAEEGGVAPIELVEFLEQNCPRLPPTV